MRSDLQQLCSDDYDNDDCNGGGGKKNTLKHHPIYVQLTMHQMLFVYLNL